LSQGQRFLLIRAIPHVEFFVKINQDKVLLDNINYLNHEAFPIASLLPVALA
jgi:hypothetical protein